jgi:hypothetical protein
MDGDRHNGVGTAHEGGGVSMDTMELVKAEFPSICPKIKTVRRLVPPQPDLAWIKDFEGVRQIGVSKTPGVPC